MGMYTCDNQLITIALILIKHMFLKIKLKLHGYVCAQLFSHVRLFTTPWTVACQAFLSMGFSRQEC